MLLPTAQSIRAQSLRGHLALEALRAGYAQAEQVLERSAVRATAKNIWRLEDAEALVLERLLTLHDEQRQHTPVNAMREAHQRLVRFAQSSRSAPWSSLGD